ncbi:kinase [Alteromonas sp. 5E99-2]|uniref:kinase n=1 Tax=Alteromonas sp. 5E99-2 TaxID=2817683 RepID=UPI001A997919|nr:kinase [Alteromonas sp. 5E99-2]MBO1255551.1 kinase [Alteromonas sp. 5E99-2]
MSIDAFLKAHKLPESYKQSAQKWFTPLVNKIGEHQKGANEPFILGIQGCQGSGKSTLADYVCHELKNHFKLNVVVCSLDDFYLSQQQRGNLAKTVHPLLQTRGVPGTHDTQLLEQVLLHINQPNTLTPLKIPRFDKSTDNPEPRNKWPVISMPVDVFILEGWCWGIPSQDDDKLTEPVNDLERNNDDKGIWRKYVNKNLKDSYEPLYGLVNEWVMLKAPSFEQVATWREEQEQKLRAKQTDNSSNSVMSPAQVIDFIAYFKRLTEHALKVMPARSHWVYELGQSREIVSCTLANGECL